MHRFALLVPILLAIVGCGTGAGEPGHVPPLVGAGEVDVIASKTGTMTIIDTSNGIAIKDDGDRPDIPATVNENSATITDTTCDPSTDAEGSTTTTTMTDGTLTMSLTATVVVAGAGGTVTCPGSFAGRLAKQAD